MAERYEANENIDCRCEKCGGKLFCPNCRGINDILKQTEKQASIANQKLANESNVQPVHGSNMPDNMHAISPMKSHVEDKKGLRFAYCNKTKEVVLNICNHGGNPYTADVVISCELKSAVGSSDKCFATDKHITRSKPGEYEVKFQPTNTGKYMLHIKVNEAHIEGSPFPIHVINCFDANNAVEIITGVSHPQGIAINACGEIIVVEYKRQCVSIFDSSGNHKKSFGTGGSEIGQFDYPCGVALDKDDNILVADG